MNVRIVSNDSEYNDALFIRKTVFIKEQKVPEHLEIDKFENQATHFIMYDENDNPIGAGRFRLVDGIGKIERVCVLSSHRNKQFGKLLMEKIEEFAKETGISKTKLNAQIHAEKFYKRLGYETVSDIFIEAGIPHVTMIKQL